MRWQKILAEGFGHVDLLLEYLDLPKSLGSTLAEKHFKTRVPKGFADRMERGNPDCPLLLQVLASVNELENPKDYVKDPLLEANFNPLSGLIHKYHGRVLLTLTGTCAVNCRYCFRRHFPYQDNNPGRKGWHLVIDYIKNNPDIHEVILSGGDPLMASNDTFSELIHALEECPSIKTLRIHSRIPVVLPERIDEGLLSILAATTLNKVMVIHCNHANEIDESVKNALFLLKDCGFHLLNQSVLLKGVNDHEKILQDLSFTLFDAMVLPYYLHLLDKVDGAHHFDLSLDKAKDIHTRLQALLPGYLVPKLVREDPLALNKTLV